MRTIFIRVNVVFWLVVEFTIFGPIRSLYSAPKCSAEAVYPRWVDRQFFALPPIPANKISHFPLNLAENWKIFQIFDPQFRVLRNLSELKILRLTFFSNVFVWKAKMSPFGGKSYGDQSSISFLYSAFYVRGHRVMTRPDKGPFLYLRSLSTHYDKQCKHESDFELCRNCLMLDRYQKFLILIHSQNLQTISELHIYCLQIGQKSLSGSFRTS